MLLLVVLFTDLVLLWPSILSVASARFVPPLQIWNLWDGFCVYMNQIFYTSVSHYYLLSNFRRQLWRDIWSLLKHNILCFDISKVLNQIYTYKLALRFQSPALLKQALKDNSVCLNRYSINHACVCVSNDLFILRYYIYVKKISPARLFWGDKDDKFLGPFPGSPLEYW